MAERVWFALFVSLMLFTRASSAVAPQNDTLEALFRPFAERHCVSCHGSEVQRRKLRLDRLPDSFADRDTAATWSKVLDRLGKGDMPPQGKERPPEKEKLAVLAALKGELHKASLVRQQSEGRVVLRRLNRVEYESTLRDLLGTPVEVKDLLPEDGISAGFDNVSTALDVSATHLLRYQQTAEKALRSVIPNRPAVTMKQRRTGKQITEHLKLFLPFLGKSAKLDEDTLVLFTRTYGHIPCATPAVPVAGRYRVRASVQAVGSEGNPLPMMCVCRDQYGRDDNDVRAVWDVPADKPTLLSGEFELHPRQVIVFNGWSLPSERSFNERGLSKDLKSYKGPGLAFEWVEIEGPLGNWPGPGYQRLFADVPLEPQSAARARAAGRPIPPTPRHDNWWIYDPLVISSLKPREDAERLMRSFLPKAFRRPVSEELQQRFIKRVHDALDRKQPFAEAMILGYKEALCSPHFLFLNEPMKEKGDQRTVLDDHAVASRLSYFLWSSMPDDELIGLAAKGNLKQPEVLRTQVERLLKDERASRFTANFAGQWLDLRQINATSPDPQIYPEFDDFLFWSMPRETERFFEEVLNTDRSLTDFVHSDWTFLNERLAQHYGVPAVHGGELRKVKLPADSHRGGVMTHASVLKVTADGTRTSPVLRGKWVLERLLGQSPEPPPPDIPTIEPDIRGTVTIRQQLDKHRNTPACASCHRHIDPPGFALETFDAIGGRRDFYRATRGTQNKLVELPHYPGRKVLRGADVEKGGITAEGAKFSDIDDYKQLLLTESDQLARNVAHKLLIYATGADIQFADREVVEQLVARSREKKYGFRSLLHEVVQSRVFLNK